jgi:hypothetical protein
MAISIEPFQYASSTTPKGYVCSCGKTDRKLYREYQTFLNHQKLHCVDCALKNQNKELVGEGRAPDQIGWLVAAVPTEDGSTFWGFSSVPQAGCDWWHALPDRA